MRSITRPESGIRTRRRTGVEREIAFDAFAPRVLAPEGDRDQQDGRSGREERENPEGDGPRDCRLAEKLLALGVDRLLSE